MPIYEYQCKQCAAHFEKRQSVSDEPLRTCEKCGGDLEKKWSLSGFQFKGAGWYVTDYSGKKDGKGENAAGEISGKTAPTEKSSAGESTASAETASKPKSEPAAKKDGGTAKT